ncbi:MAG: ATP-binding protein [Elainellaceae cyanobacterium]
MPLKKKKLERSLTAWLNHFDTELSISHKIGLGYLVAIGLGFTGTILGLLFADYLQGQGIEQLVDAQQQSQLLQRFQASAQEIQIGGLRLAAVVGETESFQAEREQLYAELETAETVAVGLERFLDREPMWLAENETQMRSLMRSYLVHLEDYIAQIDQAAQGLNSPFRTEESPGDRNLEAQVQQTLLALTQSETSTRLDQYHQNLSQLIQTAQTQELKGGEDMEFAQGFEKLIIVLSAIGSVAIAGLIAFRTTHTIVLPLKQVEDTAQRVIRDANFSLRLTAINQDEVGSLARSFNQLLHWIEEYTQDLTSALHTLKQTQAQLVQTEKMSSLGQMVAGVAHEINNPVNFIAGNLSHARKYLQDLLHILQLYQEHVPHPPPEVAAAAAAVDLDFLKEDYPRLIQSLSVGTDRLCNIIASLRSFSRMDQSKPSAVNIHEGIDSTLMLLQHRLKAQPHRRAIEVSQHYGDLPEVECYLGQLNQVFMNILTNAIDALEENRQPQALTNGEAPMPDGHIHIHTRTHQNAWAEIAIADNAGGIPDSLAPRIFDPFFTTKPTGKGTGLGLCISYQIVAELHGGTLTCHSTVGQGTEFVIRIPLCQTQSQLMAGALS